MNTLDASAYTITMTPTAGSQWSTWGGGDAAWSRSDGGCIFESTNTPKTEPT